MIEIKFRGVDLETGEYVYGDFVHYVPMSTFNGIVDEDGFVHEIKFGSERQLIAVDKNGKEVYEGDEVEHVSGDFCFKATFDWYREINNGFVILTEASS